MNYVRINGQELPRKTLQTVTLGVGSGSHVSGEAVSEADRITLDRLLDTLKNNDTIDFEAGTNMYETFHGPGLIRKIDKEKYGVGASMRTQYSFDVEYAH